MILDNRFDTHLSLNHFLAELQRNGFLHDYHIQNHEDAPYGLKLDSAHGKEKFIAWLSYIAKTRTKATNTQTYSASRIITRDLVDWSTAGKPHHNTTSNINSLERFLKD
jgi:hypothetical protein